MLGEQSPPVRGQRGRYTLLTVALLSTVLSAAAVADRATGFQGHVPRAITKALAWFIEPGLAAWWFTLGKVFQSFPNSVTGYVATIIFNVVLWLLAFALCRNIVIRLRRSVSSSGAQ